MNILLGILVLFGIAIALVVVLVVIACCIAAGVSDKKLEEWESKYQQDNED